MLKFWTYVSHSYGGMWIVCGQNHDQRIFLYRVAHLKVAQSLDRLCPEFAQMSMGSTSSIFYTVTIHVNKTIFYSTTDNLNNDWMFLYSTIYISGLLLSGPPCIMKALWVLILIVDVIALPGNLGCFSIICLSNYYYNLNMKHEYNVTLQNR